MAKGAGFLIAKKPSHFGSWQVVFGLAFFHGVHAIESEVNFWRQISAYSITSSARESIVPGSSDFSLFSIVIALDEGTLRNPPQFRDKSVTRRRVAASPSSVCVGVELTVERGGQSATQSETR